MFNVYNKLGIFLVLGLSVYVIFFHCKPTKKIRKPLPVIYAITPTYIRVTQKADLTRLSQTLMLLEDFHWIVVEDAEEVTPLVTNFLKDSKLNYTHLAIYTDTVKYPNKKKDPGIEQRNIGTDWIRNNVKDNNGVVFYMDDDNSYSIKLFEEMRKVKKVGIWPVGLVGGRLAEKPLLDAEGERVIGFNALFAPQRKFAVDMAGFAINLRLIKEKPEALFTHSHLGFQESDLLEKLTTVEELEPLADKCTKVYVWHIRTEKPIIVPKGYNESIEV